VPADSEHLAQRLAARTLELVDVPSESRDEAALAAHVLGVLRDGGTPARDAGDTCVLAGVPERRDRPLVLLAGHLDTVPAQGNRPGRRDADAVHGLGAADMKGSVAVMLELALDTSGAERPVDVGLVLFGREELPMAESALTPLLARERGLRTADLVLVMEPTANALQLGCLGNLNATWTFRGRSGHAARPWLADNAIHRAAVGIAQLAAVAPRQVTFDGLDFTEVASVTQIRGGIAQNVVPGEAVAGVNARYAPGRDPADAEAWLQALCAPHGELRIDSNAPSGPVAAGNPLVRALRDAGDLPVGPKQAWTPVAEFGLAGVDAVNFGPGDPAQAHTAREHVRVDALVASYRALERLVDH
jgi:succinyl-diaminopimelate desuccinylase